MTPYKQGADSTTQRIISIATITVLHLLALYVFAQATRINLSFVPTILQARFIPLEQPKEIPPPPPEMPYLQMTSDVLQIVPPEIRVAVPVDVPPVQGIVAEIINNKAEHHAASPEPPTGVFVKPRPIAKSHPNSYPSESLRANESGRTQITICISAMGSADSVDITTSSGYARLDAAAVAVGRDYQFKPATRDGKPVAVCLPYWITFGISK